jgi:hypothetical protein
MDLSTDDHRAWALAPHLVLVDEATADEGGETVWLNPETGTTCHLEASGEYVVMRRRGERYAPVVAGRVPPEDADTVLADPEAVRARRAVAHAIVAVDGAHV